MSEDYCQLLSPTPWLLFSNHSVFLSCVYAACELYFLDQDVSRITSRTAPKECLKDYFKDCLKD
jgi:hypothetical protein